MLQCGRPPSTHWLDQIVLQNRLQFRCKHRRRRRRRRCRRCRRRRRCNFELFALKRDRERERESEKEEKKIINKRDRKPKQADQKGDEVTCNQNIVKCGILFVYYPLKLLTKESVI